MNCKHSRVRRLMDRIIGNKYNDEKERGKKYGGDPVDRTIPHRGRNNLSQHVHFSQRRPIATPGCLRHITKSGWCFAMVIYFVIYLQYCRPIRCCALCYPQLTVWCASSLWLIRVIYLCAIRELSEPMMSK